MYPSIALVVFPQIVASDQGSSIWSWRDGGVAAIFVAFILGMVGNYVAQLLLERRRERAIRRMMREALMAEVFRDLKTLDSYENVFARVRDESDTVTWPSAELATSALEACLDPHSLALLSTYEQAKVPLLFRQLSGIRDDMREDWDAIRHASDPATRRREAVQRAVRIAETELPIVGTNLVDLLCHLCERQDRFASEHAAEVSARVVRAQVHYGTSLDRVWRTSDYRLMTDPPKSAPLALFAWRNDEPAKIPHGATVVVLHAPTGIDRTLDPKSTSWFGKAIEWSRIRLRRRSLEERKLDRS
jgi:hypothetical protein